MRLSEVEGFENENIIMAKFTDSQWVEGFLDGNLYMNNFNHFIEQEKRTKEKGQGDSYEGALVTEAQNIRIYDKNNNLIGTSKSGMLVERYADVKFVPLFCMALFNSKDFEVIEVCDKSIKFKLDISLEDKNKIRNAFKSDSVLLTVSPDVFVKRAKEALLSIDANLLCGPVKYVDYSIMDSKRRDSFNAMRPDFLFTKHSSLGYQREYRFVLPGIKSEIPYTKNIGDLRDIFNVMLIDDFLDRSYIEMNFSD